MIPTGDKERRKRRWPDKTVFLRRQQIILMPNQAENGMKREFGCPGPFLSIIQEQGDGT